MTMHARYIRLCCTLLGLLLLGVLGAGCTPTYQVKGRSPSELATVQGSYYTDGKWMGNWSAFFLEYVDGAKMKSPILFSGVVEPAPVDGGKRMLVIRCKSIEDHVEFAAVASGPLDLQPNVAYRVDGRLSIPAITMWISRLDTGEKITGEIVIPRQEVLHAHFVLPVPVVK